MLSGLVAGFTGKIVSVPRSLIERGFEDGLRIPQDKAGESVRKV
jgi:hypothetical protein